MAHLTPVTSHISHLECAVTGKRYDHRQIQTFSTYNEEGSKAPLYARYDLSKPVNRESLLLRENSLWRYSEFLPVLDTGNIVSLGEGMTPLLNLENLGKELGMKRLLLKDESLNPTGSFKARGLAVAVSKMKELAIHSCIVPTAGNAGGALAAYCAKANIEATVVMPRLTPDIFKKECLYYGAKLVLVDGLINDCGKKVAEMNADNRYFDVSTMKEPYRIEGKKTMGFEIAEQMNWTLPDVIFYPTGGGTGLIGIWKAFHEMLDAGWITGKLPKMIAVQTENCQPIVWSFEGKHPNAAHYEAKPSLANGLAVPSPFAERQILEVLATSGGYAMAVPEQELIDSVKTIAAKEGLFVAPEGAALLPALQRSLENKWISPDDTVVLLNTGSGYKYAENLH
jgi:threonine synthase